MCLASSETRSRAQRASCGARAGPPALAQIRHALRSLVEGLQARGALAAGTAAWPTGHAAFQCLGCDFVVDSNGAPWLLELNEAPQYGDPLSMDGLRRVLGQPLLNHMAEAIARSQLPPPVPDGSGDGECGGWQRL